MTRACPDPGSDGGGPPTGQCSGREGDMAVAGRYVVGGLEIHVVRTVCLLVDIVVSGVFTS